MVETTVKPFSLPEKIPNSNSNSNSKNNIEGQKLATGNKSNSLIPRKFFSLIKFKSNVEFKTSQHENISNKSATYSSSISTPTSPSNENGPIYSPSIDSSINSSPSRGLSIKSYFGNESKHQSEKSYDSNKPNSSTSSRNLQDTIVSGFKRLQRKVSFTNNSENNVSSRRSVDSIVTSGIKRKNSKEKSQSNSPDSISPKYMELNIESLKCNINEPLGRSSSNAQSPFFSAIPPIYTSNKKSEISSLSPHPSIDEKQPNEVLVVDKLKQEKSSSSIVNTKETNNMIPLDSNAIKSESKYNPENSVNRTSINKKFTTNADNSNISVYNVRYNSNISNNKKVEQNKDINHSQSVNAAIRDRTNPLRPLNAPLPVSKIINQRKDIVNQNRLTFQSKQDSVNPIVVINKIDIKDSIALKSNPPSPIFPHRPNYSSRLSVVTLNKEKYSPRNSTSTISTLPIKVADPFTVEKYGLESFGIDKNRANDVIDSTSDTNIEHSEKQRHHSLDISNYDAISTLVAFGVMHNNDISNSPRTRKSSWGGSTISNPWQESASSSLPRSVGETKSNLSNGSLSKSAESFKNKSNGDSKSADSKKILNISNEKLANIKKNGYSMNFGPQTAELSLTDNKINVKSDSDIPLSSKNLGVNSVIDSRFTLKSASHILSKSNNRPKFSIPNSHSIDSIKNNHSSILSKELFLSNRSLTEEFSVDSSLESLSKSEDKLQRDSKSKNNGNNFKEMSVLDDDEYVPKRRTKRGLSMGNSAYGKLLFDDVLTSTGTVVSTLPRKNEKLASKDTIKYKRRLSGPPSLQIYDKEHTYDRSNEKISLDNITSDENLNRENKNINKELCNDIMPVVNVEHQVSKELSYKYYGGSEEIDIEIVKELPLFEQMVNEQMARVWFNRGDLIIRKHTIGREVFFLKSGKVAVVSTDGKTQYGFIAPGSLFGELGVLLDIPRTASIIAIEQSLCYVLGRSPLLSVLSHVPHIAKRLHNVSVERLAAIQKAKINCNPSNYKSYSATNVYPSSSTSNQIFNHGNLNMDFNFNLNFISSPSKLIPSASSTNINGARPMNPVIEEDEIIS